MSGRREFAPLSSAHHLVLTFKQCSRHIVAGTKTPKEQMISKFPPSRSLQWAWYARDSDPDNKIWPDPDNFSPIQSTVQHIVRIVLLEPRKKDE